MRIFGRVFALALVVSGTLSAGAPARADRDRDDHRGDRDRYDHGRPHRGERPVIIYESRPLYVVKGPPDWAPAHGWRRRHETVIVVPYGLAQGRCNRSELAPLVGFLVGGRIGSSMDMIDQSCVGHSLEYVPSGRPVVWQNPDFGAQYQVVPMQTYQDRAGRYCREYSTQIVIGGRRQEAYGMACRQPDGAWERVN